MEKYVDKEGQRGDIFIPQLKSWTAVEKERPRQLADNVVRYNSKELRGKEEFMATFQRYRAAEYEKRPKLSAMSPKHTLGRKKKKRGKFPDEDD